MGKWGIARQGAVGVETAANGTGTGHVVFVPPDSVASAAAAAVGFHVWK